VKCSAVDFFGLVLVFAVSSCLLIWLAFCTYHSYVNFDCSSSASSLYAMAAVTNNEKSKSVLFVCLGNICRSPMAEVVFTEVARSRGVLDHWKIDSAGTGGWHTGEEPDSRTVKVCRKYYPAVQISHRGRQVRSIDFHQFEYIFCMDHDNLSGLRGFKPRENAIADVRLLGSFDPEGDLVVEDPYYGGLDDFEHIFHQITRCCHAFLDSIYGKQQSNESVSNTKKSIKA